jgi:glycolate oxidase FAD binding subunit
MRVLKFFEGGEGAVWRISIAPAKGAEVVAALSARLDCRAAYDWSGGLIWLEVASADDASAAEVRRVLAETGGHATLIRAEPAVRAAAEVFHPLDAATAALTRRIKHAFDPDGILNPGRMYSGV